MKKAFTIVELVVCIGIIGILSAVIVPTIVAFSNSSKENIVDIYNKDYTIIYIYNGEEITEEESKNYKLVSIETKDNIIYMYFE